MHKRQIFGLETIAAPLFQFFAMVPLFVGGQEDGNELVSAFADLASSLFETHMVAELSMASCHASAWRSTEFQKRAVEVEDCGFWQLKVLPWSERASFAYQSA